MFGMNWTTSTGDGSALRRDRKAWSISEVLIIGISTLVIYLLFLFLFERSVAFGATQLGLTEYQRLAASNCLSLVFTIAVVIPLVALVRRQNITELWQTVAWNWSGRKFVWALVSGAVLATSFNIALSFIYGTAGAFRDVRLPLTLFLYVASAVLLQPLVEEFYFR